MDATIKGSVHTKLTILSSFTSFSKEKILWGPSTVLVTNILAFIIKKDGTSRLNKNITLKEAC